MTAMDLRDLYQDLILDHGRHPRNFRHPDNANREALGHNPLCGDRLILFLTLDKQGKIADAAFQGTGCAISVASASMMTEMLKGKTREQAETLFRYFHAACTGDDSHPPADIDEDDRDRLQALAGVRNFPVRVKCATLAWHTLEAALRGEDRISTEEDS